MTDSTRRLRRRSLLASVGTLAAVGLAGCGSPSGSEDGDDGGDGGDGGTTEDGGDGGGGGTIDAGEYPEVEEWLTEEEIGGADDTYDGSIVDETDADSVTVQVGAEGNGASFAFEPSAVAVSTGTEVTWEWTGEGGQHNVVADPDEGTDATDVTFSSGEPVDSEDETYSRTFEETGTALYFCSPHLSTGMKGAVVVQ